MELWDLYDSTRVPLGMTHKRGHALKEGTFHQIIGVWTIHTSGKILLTRRAKDKDICPDKWENTGGSVLSGETVLEASKREVFEETGLDIPFHNFHFLDTIQTDEAFIDSFVAITDASMSSVTLQEGETTDYLWLSLEELNTIVYSKDFASPIIPQYESCKNQLESIIHHLNAPKLDPELTSEASQLFTSLGLNLESAITTFLKQALRDQGFPFLPTLKKPTLIDSSQSQKAEDELIDYNDAFDNSVGVKLENDNHYTYEKTPIIPNEHEANHFFDSMARFALGNYKKEEQKK